MEQRKRNTFGKFSRSKSADKKLSLSDYFKWLNDGRKLEDFPQVGLRNDQGNYEQNQQIILGHNICNFDIPVIVNKLKEYNLFSTFCETVKGFIDTMKVARKYIPKHDVENFKQQTLVKQFVGENYLAHNAIEDVDSLKTLYDSKLTLLVKSDDVFSISYHNCMDSYSDLLSSKIVSRPLSMQLAKDGISLKHLKLASVRDVNGLKFVLQDHKIPPKSVKCIQDYFQTEE
ncbi:unnamed protein product [Mytilus edulis]|uniref:DNA-directed DNA polymerase n=1 Tax=Mytilus edulis TaxID=6550 RepID=A0A8S3PXD4_MYTED|nr:unnamed protein product [Mytilus edulis]